MIAPLVRGRYRGVVGQCWGARRPAAPSRPGNRSPAAHILAIREKSRHHSDGLEAVLAVNSVENGLEDEVSWPH